ncbi:cystathionine gamma-synthase [Pseudobacteriovorax antillogorgiicola]|uniref:L-methionine gamma-lyase n=1 Tax=Pseudobacteriovorax antillogorgiicola TaxID=1513793 RepID=A0A1Y6CXR0_9BACT|nr:cystathionine gamma-synthase [Pseudobacteriovorax antillogorgiicola]TCS42871.1 cystathionine gamma-synthase [Pseudobacteriovorax antillogorgiicola]SMF82063.1 cystathionine gamma-synthase [Pseudobacteriovorax antillogorgiicola]
MSHNRSNSFHPVTRVVRQGVEDDSHHGAVIPPIHLSSTFSFEGYQSKRRYDYTRSGNPTRDLLAEAINDLEGGAGAVITNTGMSAINLVLQHLSPGDRVIASHDCYGGTYRLLDHLRKRGSIHVDFVDFNRPGALGDLKNQNVQLCWLETPSNPLLRITDVRRVADHLPDKALLVVDNTFLTPVGQQAFALGADIVVHSTTKYINGHSDVVGGAVVAKTPELAERLAWLANCFGLTGAPFDSYLTLRGLRTLPIRFAQHQKNAQEVASFLADHSAVKKVYYPGLPSHEGHSVAKKQQDGFGAMISFSLAADAEDIPIFLSQLKLFSLAESLGGVESLIAHPASMTHAAMDPDARLRAGIGDTLLRLSIGIEDAGDLISDLRAGLTAIESRPRLKTRVAREACL